MLSKFLRNASTAIRQPALGFDYLQWRLRGAMGRPPVVTGAFGTRLHTSSFADLRSTRAFVPKASEVTMIENLRSNHPVFMDVGANVGVWTVALAAAHPKATIYSFEPTPHTFGLLRENLALNGTSNAVPLQIALSDSPGVLSFQMNRSASIFNRLTPTKSTAVDLHRGRFDEGDRATVQAVALDEFCRERRVDRIGFLKIDVEGAELCVLRGAEQLLRRQAIERIWIEVDAENLQEMGDSIESLAAVMQQMHYTFHCLQADGSAGPPVDVRQRLSLNMLAQPRTL